MHGRNFTSVNRGFSLLTIFKDKKKVMWLITRLLFLVDHIHVYAPYVPTKMIGKLPPRRFLTFLDITLRSLAGARSMADEHGGTRIVQERAEVYLSAQVWLQIIKAVIGGA